METVFDHKPTPQELDDIGIDALTLSLRHGVDLKDPVTEEAYKMAVNAEDAFFDIAVLFRQRNQQAKADEYGQKVADRWQQYLLGFDDVLLTQ